MPKLDDYGNDIEQMEKWAANVEEDKLERRSHQEIVAAGRGGTIIATFADATPLVPGYLQPGFELRPNEEWVEGHKLED